jgi:hypothetical protein
MREPGRGGMNPLSNRQRRMKDQRRRPSPCRRRWHRPRSRLRRPLYRRIRSLLRANQRLGRSVLESDPHNRQRRRYRVPREAGRRGQHIPCSKWDVVSAFVLSWELPLRVGPRLTAWRRHAEGHITLAPDPFHVNHTWRVRARISKTTTPIEARSWKRFTLQSFNLELW